MRAALAACVALALGAVSCAELGGDASSKPTAASAVAHPTIPTRAELRWIETLNTWLFELGSNVQVGNLDYLSSCGRALSRQVPRAPTSRLRRFTSLAERMCSSFERGALQDGTNRYDRLREQLLVATTPTRDRALPVRRGMSRESRIDPVLGRVAGSLVGRSVEARCWSDADWRELLREIAVYEHTEVEEASGFADVEGGRIHLSSAICDPLGRFVYARRWPATDEGRLDLAFAVVVLAHETQHRIGVAEEAVAECRGMQLARRATRLLGADRAQAAELAELYWEELYPKDDEEYGSPECRDGGALDVNRASSVWP